MQVDDFMRFGEVSVQTAMYVAAPILILGLAAGLFVSIFQAATSISDSALAFIPKIGATLIGIIVFGHYMLNQIAGFTIWVFHQIPNVSP